MGSETAFQSKQVIVPSELLAEKEMLLSQSSNFYVCCGPAIQTVSDCEHQCGPQDVMVDESLWSICEPANRYNYTEYIGSNRKVYYRLEGYATEEDRADLHQSKRVSKFRHRVDKLYTNPEISMHYSFLIPSLRKKIAKSEAVEYLSELRTISVLFARLEVNEEETVSTVLISKLQRIVVAVQKEVKQLNGVVTKLLMFDKGLSFLCVFGLSGYKFANDSEHALKAGLSVVCSLRENPSVKSCSVGVCTGVAFCGVIGHPDRCEYTVIGRKVNMAARLMVAYPNIVSCDKDTFLKSGLGASNFSELQPKELKGLRNEGMIRSYEGESQPWSGRLIDIFASLFPIVDRVDEINVFKTIVDDHIDKPGSKYDCVAITGEPGCGRSRLIMHFAELLTSNDHYRHKTAISYITVAPERRLSRFWALRQLALRLLNMKESKKSKILSLLPRNRAHPHLLNTVLGLDFPRHVMPPKSLDLGNEVCAMILDIFQSPYICSSIHDGSPKITILFVDNIYNVDNSSAFFLSHIARATHCILVYTLKDPLELDDNINPPVKNLINMERTKHIHLRGLSDKYHSTIACQILKAGRISARIVDVLRKRSSGLPGRISNIINEIELNGFIRIDEVSMRNQLVESGVVDKDEAYNVAMKDYMVARWHDDEGTILLSENQSHLTKAVFAIAEKVNMLTAYVHSADPSVHVLFDRLPDSCQHILKLCSMVGLQFDSGCIRFALNFEDNIVYSKAVSNLFAMKFVMCSQNKRSDVWWRRRNLNHLMNSCECSLNPSKNCSRCLQMKFVTLSDMETANSYIVNEFRTDFLPRLIEFYEIRSYRCRHACEIGERRASSLTDIEKFKNVDLVNNLHETRFLLWYRNVKAMVDNCTLPRSDHLLPHLVDFLSAKAFRKPPSTDKYTILKQLDWMESMMTRIKTQLDRCCPVSSACKIPQVKLLLSYGIPRMLQRLDFCPFQRSNILDVVDIFSIPNRTRKEQTHYVMSSKPFDLSMCRCNTEISRGYRTLMNLCSQEDKYKEKFIYYALSSIHTDITLNEAFDARHTLEEVLNIVLKQTKIDDNLQALLEYFNSVVAFRTKDVKKALDSCAKALKVLKADCYSMLAMYQARINGFVARPGKELMLIAMLLIHNCRCYMFLNQIKGAYDMAMMAIQILPDDSFMTLPNLCRHFHSLYKWTYNLIKTIRFFELYYI